MDSGQTRNLSDYLGVLRRRWKMIFGITLLAAAAAFGISQIRTTKYEASAALTFVNPSDQAGALIGGTSANYFPQNAAAAGAETITRNDVLKEASAQLGGDPDPDQLKSDTSVKVDPANSLVTMKVSGPTAEEAAQRANKLAEATATVNRDQAKAFYHERAAEIGKGPGSELLIARLNALATVAQPATVVSPAKVPDSPASPKPVRDTIIAAFLGLLLGIAAAFVAEALDRRVTDAHQVQRRLGIPLVGYVRDDSLGTAGMSSNGSSGAELEPFRILRKNVDFMGGDEPLNVIAVTSPLPEEGKSTVASWYAYASALVGRRTVLVECDFRRPVASSRLGFDPEPGLSDYLSGDADPKEVLRTVDVEGRDAAPLPVIPAGGSIFQPTEMLASKEYSAFLGQLREAYDLVVIDCPPLLPVGDTLEILPHVDGVLLCVRLRQTTVQQASAAAEVMDHLADKPKGLVMTGLTKRSDDDYYGYYSSNYESRVSEPSLS